ncbi:hypothetical protein ACPESV_24425 [Streptomyces umbrinus]|uniref:hypothetical protein n=1 Tax=Streptomyces umbrinus TaxID=67370 RepID=UPI003C30B336
MTIDSIEIRGRVTSHAQAAGWFGQVLKREPVSAPGSGFTYAVWVSDLSPVPASSGLASTTARLELTGRIYVPADTEPMDDVDDQLVGATDVLMTAYSGGFTLGGNVRCIDLLGAYGAALRARYGYLPIDSTTYRIATMTIPIIVNNAWTQEA